MKVIIAGSRDLQDKTFVHKFIDEAGITITQVVCGCCEGVDRLGYEWARDNNVPVIFFPAWWTQHTWAANHALPGEQIRFEGLQSKIAGPRRNALMVQYADALIVCMKPGSRGTRDCIEQAIQKRIPIKAAVYEGNLPGHRRSDE